LAFFFASMILTRKDIIINKVPIVSLLYVIALFAYVYMTMGFNAYNCSKHVWVVIFLIITNIFNYYFIYYILYNRIRNMFVKIVLGLMIAVASITFSLIILTQINVTPPAHITIYQLLRVPQFHIMLIILSVFTLCIIIIKKRYYLFPISLLGMIISISFILHINPVIINIIYMIYYIYLPIGCYRDFTNQYHCRDLNVLYNINAVRNMDFGVMLINRECGSYSNRFVEHLLNRENVDFDDWIKKNINKFDRIEHNDFKKVEIEIGKNSYYFFILKQQMHKHNKSEYLLFIFDTTRTEILERMSERYNDFLSNETAKKIYNYNYQHMLEDNRYFLRGFSHNSFNLISIITTGMQYLKETMNELETLIFSSGSLNKKRKEINRLYYNLENTLKLTDSGVSKINESFKKLSNRIILALSDEKSVFSFNEGVQQEIFFYIQNTMHQFSLNTDIKLTKNDKDVNLDYNAFATIMHDIIKFMIDEIYEEKNPVFRIETENNEFADISIKLSIMIKEFNKTKIDNI
ncbi:hypothetical protein KAU15_06425, partial [candidate division WOR-3 bacterium]|nr:hypothetical protein [candidate division WOR-3 bacterium]